MIRVHVNPAALGLAMLLVCSLLVVGSNAAEEGQKQVDSVPKSARSRFTVPKLFDFERFKQLFKKSYNSLVENLARKRLYLARAVKVFLSGVSYKHRRSSSYLAVNQMSDWTPREEAKLHLSREHMEAPIVKVSEGSERTLGRSKRVKRGSDRNGANFEFQPSIEFTTWDINSPGFVASNIKNLTEWTESRTNRIHEKSGDVIYFDHREDNCLNPPEDQGFCASCYAFSTLALYEWSYCIVTGKKISLSRQYVVDCGDRSGMAGCEGGNVYKMLHFANNYGFELGEHYPYRTREDTCPYDASTPSESMGNLRVKDRDYYAIPVHEFERLLPLSPMVVLVACNDKFTMYGGGVDKPENVSRDTNHAMLLVGHGREDGEEYWLIMNSYGPKWGVEGHYKLSKKFSSVFESYGLMLRSFEIVEDIGARKVAPEVLDRSNEYLTKKGEDPSGASKPKPGMIVHES